MTRWMQTQLVAGNQARAYGGALMARLLTAADELVRPPGRVHAFHGHFLRPGRIDVTAELSATVLRSSRAFSTIEVRAEQAERLLATAVVSFHVPETSRGHTARMLNPPRDWRRSPGAEGGPIPPAAAPIRAGFDLRDAGAGRPTHHGDDGRPVFQFWVRARWPLAGDTAQAAALTWASDLCLTHVADADHVDSGGPRQAASLDHTLWFHRTVDVSRWLLYELSSPVYEGALALSVGRFFDESGRLVASVTQESLLRRRPHGP
jgi:acyl-CoA thioesterase-2